MHLGNIGTIALIGGLVLAAVLLWAALKNRQRTPREERRTEEATRELYRQTEREDQQSDPDPA